MSFVQLYFGAAGTPGRDGVNPGDGGTAGGSGGPIGIPNTDPSRGIRVVGGAGGAGGSGAIGGSAGAGGNGGYAGATTTVALDRAYGTLGYAAAVGGAGGDSGQYSFPGHGANGGAGGSASANVSTANALGLADARAYATGGAGGAGQGFGFSGGSGGTASATAYAKGISATAAVTQVGGTGGSGFSGGAGADSTVVNAVGGQAINLRLLQTAIGGAGGGSYGGAAGHGGAAKSQLVFSETAAGSIYAKSTARGGAGGDGVYGAAGGTANAQAAVSGTGGVDVVASATGGSGGAANYGAGDGGAGGAAKGAQIFAGTTSGTTIANASATGGRGGSGYGAGHSGGAGGAAYGSYAFASGDSAQAEVSQTGGMGGLGLEGADGGAGGDSTLSNRVAGRSRGGYLRLIQTATGGTGGDSLVGSAGRGGSAISGSILNDTANPVAASLLYGKSTAFGGGGGDSSFSLASGGAGGGAAAGVALKGAHTVDARAYAYGGAGGRGLVSGELGGAGGAASGSAAYASGYTANASVLQTGGAGGGGYSGGGAGADSTLTNAVSGKTTGGYLTLSQTATGGAGGYSRAGTAGAGGNAYSTLAFDDTANPVAAVVFTGNSTAHGGAGGTGKYGASGGVGGGAFARAVMVGTGETSAHATATGGTGGAAGPAGANGGAGGEAKGAQALMAVATGMGVAGADETGGTGGKGYGVGHAGGAGGAATGSLAFAAGYSASVGLVQTGGDGGAGAAGADGGAGGDSKVVGRTGGIISVGTHANPPAEGVSGQTYGGSLDLSQTATGGAGGYSSTGVGGRGGDALSSFSFDDTKNAVAASSIYGRNKAVGGAGGNTASGSETGGAGGAASGLVSVKGSHAVTAYNYVTGGAGGNGGIGGNGGAAIGSHAAAISTATSGRTYARAIEIGGMGGTGFGPGNRAGAHGGTGGAASGSSAFAAGYNADAAVQQTGGAGGIGLNGASGGAGGSSTLADAVGGQTGGGYLELRQTATGGAGGDSHGANGGRGGLATSSLTFDDTANLVASSFINGVSAAYGGKGGTSIADSSNSTGDGGIGGLAQSTIDLTGTNIVKTYADAGGGTGGRGYGVGHSGGAGGTASASHSFASGHSVRAAAYQRGGDGGGGTGGADGGAGAASTLTNAVSGQTTGGYLKLNQVAVGGAGGYSVDGTAGAGGAASSAFSFDDRPAVITASSLYGRGIARGGAGGNGSYGGAGGGTAYASVDVTGAHSVKALAGAYGKAGGKSLVGGIGGAGGAASAYASADTVGSDATALANVTGGAGGDGSTGGAGGAATGATAKAREPSSSAGTQAYAKSVETAGAGGRGSGAGQSGGSGGTATGSSAFATGLSAEALVYQTGGAGGFGSDGASGGAGGNSALANAAIGYVFGSYIHLVQVASGGRGGDDDGGLAGKGGSASSALVYLPASPNFVASKVTGRSAAKGGDGGGVYLQAASLGPVAGGAGGGASATIDVTGANLVSADANSTGGAGGFGYGSGQSGGAGGAATATSARGSGQSAIVTAEQTGGAGGLGLFGAAGGAGADSTLINAVSGRTTGGYLKLSQTATGGAGGTSYGATGGAGASASSDFIFDDTTANPIQASSLYGRSAALGGAGGNGYSSAGTGGAASATVILTGADSVSAVGYARGGQGGSADTGAGSAGGDAYAKGAAIATGLDASGTAIAHASAFGGAGSRTGMAGAASQAFTSNGQLAQATALARGGSGYADVSAATLGTGVVSLVGATGEASLVDAVTGAAAGGTAAAFGQVDAGTPFGFDDGSHNAYGFATELPSASSIASAFQSHANVEGVLGASGASIFGAGTLGGAYSPEASGEREYLSSTTWTLDASTLTGDLVIGLLDTQTLGSGFDSLDVEVHVGARLALDATFTSLTAAQSFLTDHALDLGGFASVPNVNVGVSLILVSSSPGSGFGLDYLLGVAPPNAPPVTTVPGPQLLQQGISTPVSGISVADADADTENEIITVVLNDSTGILSATVAGVTESGTTLTISGNLADVNTELGTLTLLEGMSGSDTIDVATSDSRGGSDDHQIAVDSNAPPVLHLSSTQLVAVQGAPAPITMFINDADASGETFTLVLSDTSGLLSVSGLDPVSVSGSGSTRLTIVGGRGPINDILHSLTFEGDTFGSDTINIALSDGRGGSDAGQIAVAINAPPITTVPGPQLVQQGIARPISGINVADADTAGETITVVLSDTSGLLSATVAGVTESGTTLTLSGTLADVNTDLGTLTLLESAPGSDTIDVAASDSRGASDDHQIAVDSNAPPVLHLSSTQLVAAQGVPAPITMFINDADASGETFTLVLSDTSGLLSVTGSDPVSISGSGSTQLTIVGGRGPINSILHSLDFEESAFAYGSDTIDVTLTDGRGGGDSQQIAVSIYAYLITTVPGPQIVQQGIAAALSGISVSDPTDGAAGETITAVLSDTSGLFSATGTGVSGVGTTQLTIVGDLAQVNADLATVKLLESALVSDSVNVAVTGSADQTIAVGTNAPPVLHLFGTDLLAQQGVPAPISMFINDADASGETFTLVLSDTSGLLSVSGLDPVSISGSGSTQLTITGSRGPINNILHSLTFEGDAYGTDTIDFALSDGRGGSDAGQVAVTINASPATTVPGVQLVQQGVATPITGTSVADADADTAGETITMVLSDTTGILSAVGTGVSVPGTTLTISGSLAQVNADLVSLLLQENSSGTDSIDVAVNDGRGGGDDHQIAVKTTNAVPVAADDSYVVAPGGSLDTAQAQVSGVLANDSDPDGDQLTAQLHTDPSHGSLVLRADGSFVYTPNPLFDGTDSFTYLVNDGFFDSDVATVTLHVNASPLAFPHFYLVPPGQTLDIPPDGATVSGVLANAFDTEGDPLTASLAPNGGPANGTLSLNSDGSFTYTPNAGFHGADSFTYVANDGFSNSAPATVTLAVDTPPVAVNDTYVILVPGQEIDIGLDAAGNGTPGVLANDIDADGDTLSAHPLLDPFDSPKHGHVTLSADGSFVYTPNPGYTGPDSFSYFASDGLVSSNIATVSLRVAPVARSDFYLVAPSQSLNIPSDEAAISGVLVNDSDAQGDPLTAFLAPNGGPANGTLSLNPDGSFTYTPNAGFHGADSFTYVANDGFSNSAPATVTLAVDTPPVAVNDTYVILVPGQEIDIGLDAAGNGTPGVLANDTDADGDTLSAHPLLDPFDSPKHGHVTLSADGSFVYTPNPGYTGPDSFSYFASDGLVSSNIATVSLRVAPVARSDFYLVAPSQSLNIPSDEAAISGVLVNDSDAQGDPLTAFLAPNGGPANGTLSLNPDGSFTYTPNVGFHGADSFTYVANDGFSDSNIATVTLAVDTPPVAVDDTYVMLVPGQEIDIGLDAAGNGTPGVLANDTDADGDTLSAHPLLDPFDSPKHGHVALSADGSFVYTPNPGYTGPDSFAYIASDGFANSNIATVTLRVPPVAVVVSAPVSPIEGVAFAGQVATFTSSNPNDTADSFTATVDWGDGTVETGTVTVGNGNFAVSVPHSAHSYADEGDHTATVTVMRTADGSTTTTTASGTITVGEGDVLTTPGPAVRLSASSDKTVTGSVAFFSDTDRASRPSDFTATIDWGDGTTTTGDVSGGNGAFTVAGTHSYTAAGQDTVTVTLADDAPGTATATSSATAYIGAVVTVGFVGSPAPSPIEGTPFSGLVASFRSSNPFDTTLSYTAMIDWGDGTTTPGTISGGNGAFFVSGPGIEHRYSDEGAYNATVTVTRIADNTSSTASGKITVLDADTLGAVIPVQPVNTSLGQTFTAVATFIDVPIASGPASPATDFTATIDWGDGTATAGIVSSGSGGFESGQPETLTVSGTHAYTTPDRHSFTVTLTDDAPGAATATSSGTIYVGATLGIIVDPTAGTAPPPVERHLFSGQVAAFTSSNPLDTAASYSAVIDWGDGTSSGTITQGNGEFIVSGQHTYLDDGSYPMKVTVVRAADGMVSTGSSAFPVSVGDDDVLTADPPVLLSANPRFAGFVGTFTNTDTLTQGSDFLSLIDWGDGTVTSGGVAGAGGTLAVFGGHTYAATGHYKVTVSLSEDSGAPNSQPGFLTTTMVVETMSVSLSGSAREGSTLIATPTLSGNVSGSAADVTYQWMRGSSAIGGATGSTYRLTEADEFSQITVQASFTDAGTGQPLNATSNQSGVVLDPPPTLSVSILGTAQENQTLQAIAVASSGDAIITYQWQQLNGVNWVNISGATGPTYRVIEPNENHQLRVLARSSDPDSGNASATSAPTAAVIDVTPTISVTVSGSAQEGQLLSATAIVTTDGDGGHTTYQWQEQIGSSWLAIGSATSASFRATEPVEGLELRVMATFTDDTGQSVSATSDPTAPVVDPTPALSLTVTGIAQEGRTLTAHPHITSDADGGTTTYQWQRRLIGSTWTDIVGAQASTYQVTEPDEGFELRATAIFTDDTGQTAAAASTATASVIDIAPTLSVSVSGTAQDGQTLEATAIANDADASVSFQWQQLIGGTWADISGATASSYQIDETNEGARLRVSATSADPDGGGITVHSAATAPVADPPPTLTIASSSLFVVAGGSVALPISVTGFDADDRVSVTIAGLPAFETITDALDPRTFAGASVSLTAAEVNSGLTLHSHFTGSGQPVNVLTVTAATTTAGKSSKSAAQSIVVTDPPPANGAAGIDGSFDNAGRSGARANPGLQLNTESTGTAGPSGGNFTIRGTAQPESFGASTANAAFAPGDTAILWHDASSQFNGVVAGLALGNSRDLADIAFGRDTTLVYTPDGDNTAGTLSASDGSHNTGIALLGQYMASSLVMAGDGHGGTLLTDPPSSQTQILKSVS